MIYDRQAGYCELCRTAPIHEVHHIVDSYGREWDDDLQTLTGLCRDCHRWVHRRERYAVTA